MKRYFGGIAYNFDRLVKSIFLGGSPQDTLSSEIGKHESNPIVDAAADVLDKIQKNHVENAEVHAKKLESADDGEEY